MIINKIIKNTANIITVIRLIAAIIFFIIYFKIDNKLYLKLIFILISMTDFLDGYIARKFKQESMIGEILDPIADKLLTISILIIINIKLNTYIILFPTIIIIIREIVISYLRKKLIKKYNKNIQVNKIGKIKTILQFIGLTFLINNSIDLLFIENILGLIFIYISIIPLIVSFYIYFKKFILLDRK